MKLPLRKEYSKEKEQAIQELKILEDDVAAAYDFLRENCKDYFQGKKKIPIYLILGPSRFGKTTILSQAGLDLIDVNNEKMTMVSPTKYCSFWFTKNALYIDTAGEYTKPDITKPRNDLIWQGFIKLLQKYFGKKSIAGILIVLDLPAVAQDKDILAKTLFCVRERIYEISTFIKTLNTHIVFTKCDCISGFTEFFSLLDAEERLQPFGISFADNKKNNLIPFFEEKFNELLKQLNNRVVENLQKSVRPKDRPLIKMFPSQMDSVRQTLIEVLGKIPNSSQILLSGIYFTSSIQKGLPINPIKTALLHSLKLKEKPKYNLESNNDRSYFVESIFKKTIASPAKKKHKRKRSKLTKEHFGYIYALLIATAIVVASTFLGYKNYQKNTEEIDQLKHSLQTQDTGELHNLYATAVQTEKKSKSWWLKTGINKPKTLSQFLKKTHQVLFIKNLTSQLEGYLDTALNSQGPIDSRKVYRGLQAYLMFEDPNKLDKDYIKDWFNEYWEGIYSDSTQRNKLNQQLDTVLLSNFKADLDLTIIESTRNYLNNLSTTQLIYLLLENSFARKNTDTNINESVLKMYTRENFNKVYNESIAHIANNIPKHDWVLGNLKLQLEEDTIDNTIAELKDLYIEKFVFAWKTSLEAQTKIELKNLQDTVEYLSSITSSDSKLIKLLQQIKHNTNIEKAPAKLTEAIDSNLKGFSTVNIPELQKNLSSLSHYITTITQSPNPSKTAFASITKYYQNKYPNYPIALINEFAQDQPKLLQDYLRSVSSNVWQILFTTATTHINQAWEKEVAPKYKTTLENRYPLFKNSKEDIALDDFNNFFGPQGIIDVFFSKYIKEFVNTEKTAWTWKEINGQKVELSKNTLEVFLRAALIQKMFYPSETPDPKLNFTLTPTAMTANTQSFTIHIDGQKFLFTDENKKSRRLTWPGPQPGLVTMTFVNSQGKYFTTSEFGPWAWFKSLDKAKVISGSNTKVYELTFDLNDNVAKFKLSTTEPMNPFIPEIINNFRCPERLD